MNFPEYNPPDEIGMPPKEKVEWTKSLSVYKTKSHDKNISNWVYCYLETDVVDKKIGVVIYDRYPKGSIHLLLLPLLEFANVPAKFKKEHLPILRGYHRIARLIAAKFGNNDNNFKIGYHARPSMKNDLHIHIVSIDDKFTSSKRRESFRFPKFLSIDFVEQELETHDDLSHLYKSFEDDDNDHNDDVVDIPIDRSQNSSLDPESEPESEPVSKI